MSTYEASVSAVIEMESDHLPTEEEVIEFCRKEPDQLLHYLELDFIEKKKE